jgi:hypothetical protein
VHSITSAAVHARILHENNVESVSAVGATDGAVALNELALVGWAFIAVGAAVCFGLAVFITVVCVWRYRYAFTAATFVRIRVCVHRELTSVTRDARNRRTNAQTARSTARHEPVPPLAIMLMNDKDLVINRTNPLWPDAIASSTASNSRITPRGRAPSPPPDYYFERAPSAAAASSEPAMTEFNASSLNRQYSQVHKKHSPSGPYAVRPSTESGSFTRACAGLAHVQPATKASIRHAANTDTTP